MENKSNHLVASIICGILTIFGIVTSIISLLSGSNNIWFVADLVLLLLSLLIGYYAVFGYKKPHGNLLKIILLLYAGSFLANLSTGVCSNWVSVLIAIIIGLICYVAGRLNKVRQNLYIMILVTICLIVLMFGFVGFQAMINGAMSKVTIWIDICVAYFLRYKEHKEAGLIDA